MPADRSPATQEARLAEFAALRQEIAQRSSHQHALMVINLTAVAAVAGLVLGRNIDRSLILAIPFLSSALALQWFAHHTAIAGIGAYIHLELWQWEPSWDQWGRDRGHAKWWDRTFWPSIQLVFCGAPIAALVIGLPRHGAPLAEWVLWSLGFVLTVWTTIRFLIEVVP